MKKILFYWIFLGLSFTTLAEDIDPFEDVNRVIYNFNETLDENLLEPVAITYRDSVPVFAQNRVRDFFGNLEDVKTFANQLLQFKLPQGLTTLGRVVVNTTVGLGGLFDVASELELSKSNEDFGQTLATWSVSDGPYIVLPFFGPSTLRDSVGVYVHNTFDIKPVEELDNDKKNIATMINLVSTRVELLPITNLLKKSDDAYITARTSYLQKRKYDIYDGNPPVEEDDF